MFLKTRQAFTLIELLIVVAIIAILAAIAVPNFLEAQTRSKVSRTKADQRSVATALETYFVDYSKYPRAYEAVNTAIEPRIERFIPITTPVAYMTSIPQDVFSRDVSNLYDEKDVRVFIYTDRRSYEEFVNDPYGTPVGQNLYSTLWGEQFTAGQWILRSRGPVGIAGGVGIDITPAVSSYDPTNGTVSAGNIMLLGPGIGFGDGG